MNPKFVWKFKDPDHMPWIGPVAFSAKDQYVAIGSNSHYLHGERGVIEIRPIQKRSKPIAMWAFNSGDVHSIRFLPERQRRDGRTTIHVVATAGKPGRFQRAYDKKWVIMLDALNASAAKTSKKAISPVADVVTLKDGKFLTIDRYENEALARFWDTSSFTPKKQVSFGVVTPIVSFSRLSHDGTELAMCDPHKGVIQIYDAHTAKLLRSRKRLRFDTAEFLDRPGNRGVLVLGRKDRITFWDSHSGRTRLTITAPKQATKVFISRNGHFAGWIIKDLGLVIITLPRHI